MVSFPFEKGKKLYKKNQRLKQWQIICEQQRHNWQNYIFIACALPSPLPQPGRKEIIQKNQRLKQWQIICEQQRHNWKNHIFIACALPPPTWMERDTVRVRSPD